MVQRLYRWYLLKVLFLTICFEKTTSRYGYETCQSGNKQLAFPIIRTNYKKRFFTHNGITYKNDSLHIDKRTKKQTSFLELFQKLAITQNMMINLETKK